MKIPVEAYWYSANAISFLLLPLSWMFCFAAWLRRAAYARGLLRQHRLPVPVIVVGNITVGGTGKTPLVIWIVEHLMRKGYRPGVISRGYGGRGGANPLMVHTNSDPKDVGDEPVLIARRTGCPVCVGPDRPQVARMLTELTACDIIVSDDGLQHYALARDVEIVVIDGLRRFGNGYCLPAGPLREKRSRLSTADIVVCNGEAEEKEHEMRLLAGEIVNLKDEGLKRSLEDFIGGPVHAVAGIGNPLQFFESLRLRGLEIIEHPFRDHYTYVSGDFNFKDEFPVLMTEKDAVKCSKFARLSHWYLRTDAELGSGFSDRLDSLLRDIADG